ncbi:MAG: hypothetical protein IIB21_02420, partial [Chloroflexi bacterium]|nr:hypothetical protein [Chloroflexota bacterium]
MAKNEPRRGRGATAVRPQEQIPAAQPSRRPVASGDELSPGRAWNRRHLLDLDDFSPAELELVMETTDAMKEVLAREVPRVPALRGTTIVTLFYEASTRTRASFELAGKVLGADVITLPA